MFAYDPQLASQAQNILKSILSIPRAKDTPEAASKLQTLDELIRRYERNKLKHLDEDIYAQRIYDISPAAVESHLVLENRDKQPTFEDLKRRAGTWIMANASGRAPMIDNFEQHRQYQYQHQDHQHIHNDTPAFEWTMDPWNNSNNNDYNGGELYGFKGSDSWGKGSGESEGKGGEGKRLPGRLLDMRGAGSFVP